MKRVLEAKGLIKKYGANDQIVALDGISLTVNEGDFICIMGPSGSGKSTLINILATLDKQTKGALELSGKKTVLMDEIEKAKYRYENIGFIFQDFNLIDSLTVRENIGIPLVLANVNKEEVKNRVEDIAEKINVTKVLDKFPTECSGGEKQRAAAARALVTKPNMVIADEPTGNLDTKNSHELLQFMKKLNEEDDITIVMVTHDSMIASYSKKLIFIRDGKIDETIEKGGKSQTDFFHEIVKITSKENQTLIEGIGKEQ